MPHMAIAPKPPIRVLWLTKGLGPGGAERLLVSFAAIADRERFDLRAAYLLPWKDHLVAELAGLGVPAVCLDGRREVDPRWVRRLRKLVRAARIDVVHAHSPLVAALARLGVGHDELLVVTVANLRAQKDYPTMLQAARRLADAGEPVCFVSVGQGPLAEQLEGERDRLGLGERFRFLGYREDPVRVLVAAH